MPPCSPHCPCGSDNPPARCCGADLSTQLTSAGHHLKGGRLAEASGLCYAVLKQDPDNAEANRLLASTHVADGADLFQRRQLRMAAARCGVALDLDPDCAEAYQMLGAIGWQYGLFEVALEHLRTAVRLGPDRPPLIESLTMAEQNHSQAATAWPKPDSQERFLLIRAWGAGFWSDVSHVLCLLLVAELSGRTPVVHWGANSRFSDNPGQDAFGHFFEPVSERTVDDLPLQNATPFPPKWPNGHGLLNQEVNTWNGPHSRIGPLELINRPEALVVSDFFAWGSELTPWIPHGHPLHGKPLRDIYRYLTTRYLRARQPIVAQAQAFRARHLGSPYIAVHIRATDKASEISNLERLNAEIHDQVNTLISAQPNLGIFLMTDSETELARFRDRYGARVVTTSCLRSNNHTGVHFLDVGNRQQLGEEVMIDVLVATEATHFIGNATSNVSCMVPYLASWPEGAVTLVGEHAIESPLRPLNTLSMP